MTGESEAGELPEDFGPYRCVRKLAVGGMGEVYLAEASGAGNFRKRLVIKAVRADRSDEKDIVEAFLDEARVWAMLTHPNIVPLFDCVWLEGRLCLVMEYIEGADLRELIQAAQEQKRNIHAGVVIHILTQLAAGLHAAHEARGPDGKLLGIVHRDVSPHNLLVDRQVNARLCDFGIARSAVRQNRTRTGRFKGKFAYVAPEAIRGESVDRRADVFGMGVMLYELLGLERPFRADAPLPLLKAILDSEPPPLKRSGISHQLVAVMHRALAKDLDERFPTAEAFRLALLSTPEAYPAPSETQLVAWFDSLTGIVENEPSTEPRFIDLAAKAAARSINDEANDSQLEGSESDSIESFSSVEIEPPSVLRGVTGEATLPRQRVPEPPPGRSPLIDKTPPITRHPPGLEPLPSRPLTLRPKAAPPPPVADARTASTQRIIARPTQEYDNAPTVLRRSEVRADVRSGDDGRRRGGSRWGRRVRELLPYVATATIVGAAIAWAVNNYLR